MKTHNYYYYYEVAFDLSYSLRASKVREIPSGNYSHKEGKISAYKSIN